MTVFYDTFIRVSSEQNLFAILLQQIEAKFREKKPKIFVFFSRANDMQKQSEMVTKNIISVKFSRNNLSFSLETLILIWYRLDSFNFSQFGIS